PFSAFSLAPSTLSKIHFTFVPEKYGSNSKPVLSLKIGSKSLDFNSTQMSCVCLDCHTFACYTVRPIILSQTTAVTLTYVIQLHTIWSSEILFSFNTIAITDKIDVKIQFTPCSIQHIYG